MLLDVVLFDFDNDGCNVNAMRRRGENIYDVEFSDWRGLSLEMSTRKQSFGPRGWRGTRGFKRP